MRAVVSFVRLSSGFLRQFGTDNHAQPRRASANSKPDQNAENREWVPTYQFICQVREPIVFKQSEQEMLADSMVNTTMSAAVK
jgi:hypothetical protein